MTRDIETIISRILISIINVGCELRDQGVPKAQRFERIKELSKEMYNSNRSNPKRDLTKEKPKKDLTKEEKEWIEYCKRMQVNYAVAQQRRVTELFGSDADMDMFR